MSQQGGSPTGHEDDWWGQLYDDSIEDTGPTAAPDSLDDRYASAVGAMDEASAADAPRGTESAPRRAPWEPPPAAPPVQATFPPGPVPPGFAGRAPRGRTASATGDGPSTQTPLTPVPASPMPPDTPPPPAAPARTDTVVVRDAGADSRRDAIADAVEAAEAGPAAQGRPPGTAPARMLSGEAVRTATQVDLPTLPPPPSGYVGSGPPTYDAEPTALPPADPDDLDDLVADTVLDGARYGASTLRAASVRGDSARFRGEPRRDSLLTARFGAGDQALVLVAMATGARATPGAHRAAAEACQWIGRAVGRSHARLAEDIRAGRRGELKSGLHRLTDRSLGRLRAGAAERGIDPEEYAATLRCLLLPADPGCRTRVFFGVGTGGLFRLRDGEWQDIEPRVTDVTGDPVVGFGSLPAETPEGDRLTMDLGIPTPPSPYEPAPEPPREPFRFRASIARPGDTLLMCTDGLAEPLRGEPELCGYLTGRWSGHAPPGLAAYLADVQVRVKGYADDRTAAAVWEA
ncbi:protein phosphatase 2C domain-containing protein [Streptomyces luteolifulvus]|uniref:Protein phosphatase 2C domain-containing protein n=1 Tax=Streptomyces luteolifulvus TaxID=2615112 RepID=A0A6H9V8K2_9ACTN|nr:protein phosphatase 2C domain-containing protein [Streptomyces luteolifulvus]KAB1150022.1 protein phosphatase 2C domain-containing protein [Streptomyces luteolifulvus]